MTTVVAVGLAVGALILARGLLEVADRRRCRFANDTDDEGLPTP